MEAVALEHLIFSGLRDKTRDMRGLNVAENRTGT